MTQEKENVKGNDFSWQQKLLLIVGLVFSFLLIKVHAGNDFSLCTFGEKLDCGKVLESGYSLFLGVSLADWGFLFYLSLLLIFQPLFRNPFLNKSQLQNCLLALSLLSVLFSLALFLLSEFVIGALCPFCIALYLVNILLFIVSYWIERQVALVVRVKAGATTLFLLPVRCSQVIVSGTSEARSALMDGLRRFLIAVALTVLLSLSMSRLTGAFLLPEKGSNQLLKLSLAEGIYQDHYRGPLSAKIELVVFSDIECPFCRVFHHSFEDLFAEFSKDVLFVYRNYPIDKSCNSNLPDEYHHNACYAAMFARCAGEQGQFWSVLDGIYNLPELDEEASPELVREAIHALVEEFGLDQEAMRECVASDRQMLKVKSDIEDADKIGLKGTPFVFINGKQVENLDQNYIRDIFLKALKQKN